MLSKHFAILVILSDFVFSSRVDVALKIQNQSLVEQNDSIGKTFHKLLKSDVSYAARKLA